MLLSHRSSPWSMAQMSLDEVNLVNKNRQIISSMLKLARTSAIAKVFRKKWVGGMSIQNQVITSLSRQFAKMMLTKLD